MRQHKRPDLLVEIARGATDTRFVVCGGLTNYRTPEGYCEQVIEALRKLPNVEYRGQVTPEQAMDVIADAALLLCTSDEEGFPNTFTQAWSAGTPVVSLRVDPDHIIERFALGTVSGAPAAALKDIRALLASPEHRDEIACRARRFVAENYSASAVVNLFQRALDRACS
jgi:glycosyltransferase involved in cell wall biosynthesis